jgi:predicted alpha/beta-fold hydrolase
LDFVPHPAVRHPLLQSVTTQLSRVGTMIADYHLHVKVPDGDWLVVLANRPLPMSSATNGSAASASPTPRGAVILTPGLGATSQSPHIVRLAGKLVRCGFAVYRCNPRGLGEGTGLARNVYHAARSDDIGHSLEAVAKDLAREFSSDVPIIVLGQSLGGNMVLRHAGAAGAGFAAPLPSNVCGLIALSPIFNLAACAQNFGHIYFGFAERVVTRKLRRVVSARHTAFPDLGPVVLPRRMSLIDFEQRYTLPQSGFKDILSYYEQASALPWLSSIGVPCNLIISRDDPLARNESFSYPKNVKAEITRFGGHLGFVSQAKTPLNDNYWSDWRVVTLVEQMLADRGDQ